VRRFRHWAYLNDVGMDLFGEVFPDKQVPVVSMIWKVGPLGSPDNIEDHFLVQWDELTEEQQSQAIIILGDKFGGNDLQILKQIHESGLPLRKSLTNGSGTDHPGFFLGGGHL